MDAFKTGRIWCESDEIDGDIKSSAGKFGIVWDLLFNSTQGCFVVVD